MLQRLSSQAQPLLRVALAAAATRLAPTVAGAGALQARECVTAHRLSQQAAHPSAAGLASLPVVHSEDGKAACGEPPAPSYAQAFGGLAQHGEAHHILFSDDHASVTNEVEKLLQVADEEGGPGAVFAVYEQFGGGEGWTEMNAATALGCLAREAAAMTDEAVEREIHSHPTFRRLVDAASAAAPAMTDAELAEVGAAMAGLRLEEAALAGKVHLLELSPLGALSPYSAAAAAECMSGA